MTRTDDTTAAPKVAADHTKGQRPAALPTIDLSGGDLHRKVTQAWEALVTANDPVEPRVLVRGNEIVRMTERGELEPLTAVALQDELSRAAEFGQFNDKGDWKSKDPPRYVADALRERDSQDYQDAPRVARVVDVPVVAADGTLVTAPGYHPNTEIYFRPSPDLDGLATDDEAANTTYEVEEACNLLLNDLLGDFAFADDGGASRANALGLLLLPFVRDFIDDGPTPLHAIIAPEPGTGKTLLAQVALLPGCGLVPVTAGDRDHNDEWRKSLTAALISGTRAILLDNLRSSVDSGPLASAITTGVWRDRVLGYSKNVTLPVRNAWVATGNNLKLSDEQARRTVPIFLDPGDVRPADRPKDAFQHPDLLRWAANHRAELVDAALTLVRHWLAGPAETLAGAVYVRHSDAYGEEREPAYGSANLGSFERWAEVIGGILGSAGVEGFLDNRDRLYADANEEGREAVAFLAAWHALDREPIDFSEVRRLCEFRGELHDALPTDVLTERSDKRAAKLSSWLQQHNKRSHGGFQLVGEAGSGHGARKRWVVRRTTSPSG
jgi:hypothetical protein